MCLHINAYCGSTPHWAPPTEAESCHDVCDRRQQLAAKLMNVLEDITTRMHDGYFVDLFVRASNKTAIQMYTKVSGRRTFAAPLRPRRLDRLCA